MNASNSRGRPFGLIRRVLRSLKRLAFSLFLLLSVLIFYYKSNVCSVCLDVSRQMKMREVSRHTGPYCFNSIYEPTSSDALRIGIPINKVDGLYGALIYDILKNMVEDCSGFISRSVGFDASTSPETILESVRRGDYEARVVVKYYYKYFMLYGKDKTILLGWGIF